MATKYKERNPNSMLDANDILEETEDFPTKEMRRRKRRKTDFKKAIRKEKIAKAITHGDGWYKNLHQYSKGKIHCSCPLCAFSGKTTQDAKIEDAMNNKLAEYELGETDNAYANA